ncbi:acyl carrier protein [Mycobacterium sp. Dal123C01]|uniref:acyl carrier protein n=1 Tax=Mycobacterium sp. Dal123C01 TaxID=3457577 RepID=UPI00403E5616
MTRAVRGELRDVFITDLGVDPAKVQADTVLREDLAFDSVAFAIGLVAIQERLGVQISDEELFACQTIGDIEKLIEHSDVEVAPGGEGQQ